MPYKILALHIDYQYMKAPNLMPSATVYVLVETGPLKCLAKYKRYNIFNCDKLSQVLEQTVASSGITLNQHDAMLFFKDKIEGVREYGEQ